MSFIRSAVLFIVLSSALILIGCAGGGGSAAPVQKDVTGINATLNGFMSSVVAKDPSAAAKFLAAETSHSPESAGSGVKTLLVYDFGADINNAKDNNHYSFSVSDKDIIQPTDFFATVKAYYQLKSGQPLWVTFSLIKENGVWTIETIAVSGSSPSSSSGFVASTYFPVTPGAKYTYAPYYDGSIQSSRSIKEFLTTPLVKDGMNFYEQKSSYVSGATSLRGSSMPVFSSQMYYSMQECGLWVYSESFNDGVPFKLFEATHSFGSNSSLTYTHKDYMGNTITYQNQVTFGFPKDFPTPAGSFAAVPVTFLTTVSGQSGSSTSKSILWFAPGVGQVGIDGFSQPTDAEPYYSEKLVESSIPAVTTPTTPSSIAFAEGGDPNTVYDLYAGINVDPVARSYTLRNDGEGPTLIFQTPPSGPFNPSDEIEIFPDTLVGLWNWYPSLPTGHSVSSSGNGIIVSIGTSVSCTLRHSGGAIVSFTAQVVAENNKSAIDRRTGDLSLHISNFSFSSGD